MPRLLLIAATTGYQTRAFAEAARRQGFEITLATDRCHILEDPWRDRAVPIRFEEPEASALILSQQPCDGILAVADRSTPIAALTAQRLAIPWHPPEAVRLCRNKSLMREAFRNAGLPAPRSFTAANAEFPCVLKPLELSASRGVIRADNNSQLNAAIERIRRILGSADCLIQIEQFIPGREFALEGIMTDGELRMLALFDKPDPLDGPFFEETIYVTPSRASAEVQRAIGSTCSRAVHALGLTHGPIHAEMRVNPEGVFMLEIAARPIGGLCARALRFQPNLTLEDVVVLHAAGRMPDKLQPAAPASGVMMIPTPGDGILQAVTGLNAARAVPCITGIEITAKRGEHLIPLPEGASYPGFIFAEAESSAKAEAALRRAHSELRFELLAALPTFSVQSD